MKLRENLHFSCALLSLKTLNKTKISPLSKKTWPEMMKVGVPAQWPVVAPPRRNHKHPLFQNIFYGSTSSSPSKLISEKDFHKNNTNTLRSNENKTTQTLLPFLTHGFGSVAFVSLYSFFDQFGFCWYELKPVRFCCCCALYEPIRFWCMCCSWISQACGCS